MAELSLSSFEFSFTPCFVCACVCESARTSVLVIRYDCAALHVMKTNKGVTNGRKKVSGHSRRGFVGTERELVFVTVARCDCLQQICHQLAMLRKRTGVIHAHFVFLFTETRERMCVPCIVRANVLKEEGRWESAMFPAM